MELPKSELTSEVELALVVLTSDAFRALATARWRAASWAESVLGPSFGYISAVYMPVSLSGSTDRMFIRDILSGYTMSRDSSSRPVVALVLCGH
jgi:hypothetical protein